MHGLWLEGLLEAPVQLVVQRARAVHRRDVLRDTGEVERTVAGVAERGGEVRGEVGAAVEPEHRDDTARDERLDDLGVRVVRAAVPSRRQPGLVSEDRGLEAPDRLARLEAELVESRPVGVVGAERIGLAARRVERAHDELAGPLAQRMLPDERLELRDDVGGAAELDVGRDPLLPGDEAELVEPPCLGLRPVLEGELGERRATPEVERPKEERSALLR